MSKWARGFYLLIVFGSFSFFSYLLVHKTIGDTAYFSLVSLSFIGFFVVILSERVKGITLGKLVVTLYRESRQALLKDDLIIDIGTILAKLSEHTNGGPNNRKERETMINELLKKARANKKQRQIILADTKLVTRLMATEEGPELDKIRAEINERGLFE